MKHYEIASGEIGIGFSPRGNLNVAEWLWLAAHCRVSLSSRGPATFGDSCIRSNEL